MYVSTDGGVAWMEKNRGLEEVIENIAKTHLPYLVVTGCAAAPDILYVGTLYGISKSEDGGETWSMVTDPRTDWGLYRTRDGGGIWERAAIGPGSEPVVHDIVFDPQNRQHLYLSADFADAPESNGLYHSDDRGETWMQLGRDQLFTVSSLSVCETTGDLYVLAQAQSGARGYWATRALWHSGDRGKTCEERSFPGDNASLVAVHPNDSRRVYVSTFTQDVTQGSVNLYRSTDSGAHWQAIGDSVPLSFGSDANGIVFDPHDARGFLLMHTSGTYEVKERQEARSIPD